MVDYGYEELFEEHSSVDYIIVDSGATVTAVANSAPDISGEEFLITNEEFQNECIQLKESLCSESNLKFGKMEASKITFSFKNKADYPADLTDTEIDVYLYFNGNSSTLFKVGRYTINSDKYSDDKFIRSIVAYDLLYELNKLDITEWYYKYFESGERHKIVDVLEDTLEDDGQTGLYEYIQDQGIPFVLGEDQGLVNGDFYLGRTIESDTITFEFFMQRILEFSAAFGHINRQGEFVYVYLEWYDKAPVRVITNSDRIPPTPFEMIATLGIGGIDCYDQDNIRKFSLRNSNKRKPNVYVITDSFVISDRDAGDPNVGQALRAMHDVILHCKYRASKATCSGDLCVEVGDRIKVRYYPDETDSRNWFSSYVLERSFSGIHGMTDTYQAKGDKKQPVYAIDNSNWHEGDNSTGVNGSDGVSKVNSSIAEAEYVEVVRNYGFRFMDEPKVECEYDAENSKVKLKWEDPADRSDDKPVPCIWAKTYVVRREGERALNIYQGTIVKTSTTKNEHQNTWLEDTVEENKRYYYSIMPCDTKDDVRWTCCYSVNTTKVILAPTITALTQSGVSIVASYSIPSASYDYIKLVYKKDSIPTSYSDGTAVDITQESTSQALGPITTSGTYYVVIFTDKTTSEPQTIELNYTVYNLADRARQQALTRDNTYRTSGVSSDSPGVASGYYYTGSDRFLDFYNYNDSGIQAFSGNAANGADVYLASNSWSYIRIDRTATLAIVCEARKATNKGGGYDYFSIMTGYLTDPSKTYQGTVVGNNGAITTQDTSWQEYTLTYDSPVNVDYIIIKGCDGRWEFRNFKIIAVSSGG